MKIRNSIRIKAVNYTYDENYLETINKIKELIAIAMVEYVKGNSEKE